MIPTVYSNLTNDQLIELSIQNGEGELASNGALTVNTGEKTGRSPKDRFIVKDAITETAVDWSVVNQPFTTQDFDKLWHDACQSLEEHDIYETISQVATHPIHRLRVKVRCNSIITFTSYK